MSAKGNHTIAVVNGSEKYETLQVSFKTTFSEINSLIDKGTIIVDGQEVKLEFFLGGDYKFLLTVMGLRGLHLYMPAYGVKSIKTKGGKQTSISITLIHHQ